VSANQGCVEHEIFVAAVFGESLENALPHAGLGPARKAGVNAFPLPYRSGRSCKCATDRSTHRTPSGGASRIASFPRKHSLNPSPLCVVKFVSLDHASCPESMNPERKKSSLRREGNLEASNHPPCTWRTRALLWMPRFSAASSPMLEELPSRSFGRSVATAGNRVF
jgi:hypothetical protein